MIKLNLILICLFVLAKSVTCQPPSSCKDPYALAVVNPTANVFFGVTTDLRSSGYGYGCRNNFKRSAQYLAYYYVVNEILNKNNGQVFGQTVTDYFIPGIPLGFSIYDDCSRAEISVKNIVEMIPKTGTENKYLNCNNTSYFIGVLGPNDLDSVSMTASFLKLYQIPQITYSTLPKPNLNLYPSLYKVLAPEFVDRQNSVVIKLLKDLNWSKISILFENSESIQTPALKTLLDLLQKEGICVSQVIYINANLMESEYQVIMKQLLDPLPDISGIIAFSISEDTIQRFFEAICDFEKVKELHWIFLSLSLRSILQQYLHLVRGSFIVSGDSNIPKSFFDYVMTIDASMALEDNPWFKKFYSTSYNCQLNGIDFEPDLTRQICSAPFKFLSSDDIGATRLVNPAIDSVFVFAGAFKAAWNDKCGAKPGLCDSLQRMDSLEFQQKYLKGFSMVYSTDNRSPPEFLGRKISFDSQQVIEAKPLPITVLNLKRDEELNLGFKYTEVFRLENDDFQKKAPYQFYGIMGQNLTQIPLSTCNGCDVSACVKSTNIP